MAYRRDPAVYPAVADSSGRRHVGPRPKARLFLAAQLGKQGLVSRAGASCEPCGAEAHYYLSPSLYNEGFKAARTRAALVAIDINLVGLAVQREVHGFFGVSPVNVIGQFDYHRFCHVSIMAE